MTFRELLLVSRPRFWLYEAGTFAVGAVAAFAGGSGEWSPVLLTAWFLYFLVPANFLIYGVNDVFDYETDSRNPKKRGYESLLPRAEHRRVLVLAALGTLPFLPLLAVAPRAALLPFFIFLFCAVFYSAPPLRAKARPLLDSAFSAGHYVATGWFAYALSGGELHGGLALAAGMAWAMAMHAYSAVPDVAADGESGVSTVATWLGARWTIVLCAILYAAAAALAFGALGWWAVLLLVPYVSLMVSSYFVAGDEPALMTRYRIFPYLNAAAGAVIWWVLAASYLGLAS